MASAVMPAVTELAKAVLDIIEDSPEDFEGSAGIQMPGSHAMFDDEDCLLEMAQHDAEYKGRAHTLFALCRDAHAMRGVPTSRHSVNRYREEHF